MKILLPDTRNPFFLFLYRTYERLLFTPTYRPLPNNLGIFNLFGYHLTLTRQVGAMVSREMTTWYRDYIPPSGLHGKIVLDIGANAGDSAAFFLSQGASHVIAVEPNQLFFSLLLHNIRRNNLSITPLYLSLDNSTVSTLLSIPHDFLKVDTEGSESSLLLYNRDLGECVVESHPSYSDNHNVTTDLINRFHLNVIRRVRSRTCILASYTHIPETANNPQ